MWEKRGYDRTTMGGGGLSQKKGYVIFGQSLSIYLRKCLSARICCINLPQVNVYLQNSPPLIFFAIFV